MKPILFGKNATTFTTNGIGRLDAMSCSVTEEMNGQYELTMTIAETAAHASEIEMDSIIVAKTCHGGSEQPFRVYKITKPINGRFVVYAQHISYQLSYIPTMPFTVAASASACNTTLQALKTNAAETCPFSFWTDVTTVASYTQKTPASIRSRLGGVEGSVLDQFGGEYEWDGYTVKLHANRGKTTPDVTLRYGKNITDISQEEHISNTITGVCPFWAASDGSSVVTLPEKVVESQYASQYPFKRTVSLDCSENWENAPTQAELRTYAQAYVNKAGIGIPTVSIKVSFVDLSETEEYKDKVQLQTVKLCDRIKVEFEKLGISTTAKVVKVTYDVLAERYTEIEVGTIRTSLAHTISSTAGAIDTALGKAIFAAQSATAWLTSSNGYVHAVKNSDGTWKELIFADTDDPSTWHNLLRINENGIGFSHDGGTTYSQAWTLDGKMVVGGTACPSLTVYDSNNHVLFQIDRDGLAWSATKSSMTKTGVLTASDAVLNGSISSVMDGGTWSREVTIDDGAITFSYNHVEEGQIIGRDGDLGIYANDGNDLAFLSIDKAGTYDGTTILSRNDSTITMHDGSMNLGAANGGIVLDTNGIALWGEMEFVNTYTLKINGNNYGQDADVFVRMSNGNVGYLRFVKGILVEFNDNY